jgi:Heme/copper-type cytochrome/quinol oxidases, subunit 2
MLVAIIVLVVILGSVAFHMWSPWWWSEMLSNWSGMDDTIVLTFWITGAVFVAIGVFMAYCIYKYRYDENKKAEYEPENSKLEWTLTIITTIGVIALLAPGLVVWNNFVTVPKGAYEIEVVGQQWGWMYRLPGKDGVLGTTDIRNIDDENIFGMNMDDPNGLDDILVDADDLHILKDQPVKLNLRALDVLHDFYVPEFRAKMDMVPGMITYYWFTPIKVGEFEVVCAEYCGTGHYAMLGYVIVDEQDDYNEWISEQMTFEEIMASNGKSDLIKVALNNRNNL